MLTPAFWVWLHRWVGLAMAGFPIIVGLTGSQLALLARDQSLADAGNVSGRSARDRARRLDVGAPRRGDRSAGASEDRISRSASSASS